MSITRAVWLFILGLTAIRLTLLGTTDLTFDEAHYWMWSERLAPSYFSKGPGVAFAIRAGTAIFGDTEFGVRFWSPFLGAGTSLLVYYFARKLFNASTGFWAVLAINAIPMFNVGNILMTIDPLSIFFWTAAMFTFWLAIERSPNFSWFWPVTGFLIGLGFLCKYTNAFELVSIVLVMALVPRLRREFKSLNFYCLLGAFALSLVPPLVWNAQHAWATLGHLRSRGSLEDAPGFHPLELLGFLGAHFFFFSPLLFLGIAWAVIASWRRARQHFKVLYLVWFGLPVFLFYFLLSINKQAAPNWDVLAFVSLGVLASAYWQKRLASSRAWRGVLAAGILLALAISMIFLDTDLLRSAGVPIPRRDPADAARGWKSAARAVEKIRSELEPKLGEAVFVIADQRDRASEMAFYFQEKRAEGPGHPPVYIVESQATENQFSFWPRYDESVEAPPNLPQSEGEVYTEEGGINPFMGRHALYVQSGREANLVPRNIQAGFQSTEKIATIEVRRFGVAMRTWQVFLCRSYRRLSL
ncbi:MAG TPA: glycosyltransferase family 39 protein [Chthoniobacterales bacterium]|nr:glycosyltransferase family 39 protein [Chthoniobacterales bacterium]